MSIYHKRSVIVNRIFGKHNRTGPLTLKRFTYGVFCTSPPDSSSAVSHTPLAQHRKFPLKKPRCLRHRWFRTSRASDCAAANKNTDSNQKNVHGIPSVRNSAGYFCFRTSGGIGFIFRRIPRNSKKRSFTEFRGIPCTEFWIFHAYVEWSMSTWTDFY
jgi:hypothetical protein